MLDRVHELRNVEPHCCSTTNGCIGVRPASFWLQRLPVSPRYLAEVLVDLAQLLPQPELLCKLTKHQGSVLSVEAVDLCAQELVFLLDLAVCVGILGQSALLLQLARRSVWACGSCSCRDLSSSALRPRAALRTASLTRCRSLAQDPVTERVLDLDEVLPAERVVVRDLELRLVYPCPLLSWLRGGH